MQVHHGLDGFAQLPRGVVLSIGNFDGVHLGHHTIFQTMKQLRPSAPLAVATFEPHPFTVLRPSFAPPRLTTERRKHQLLAEAGIEHCVTIPPTPDVLNLAAETFWQTVAATQPAGMVEGSSFTFGKDRVGNIDKLRAWSAAAGIALQVIDPVEVTLINLHIVTVSSSLIRWLIHYGRMRDAALCLGRHYRLIGPVIHGFARGRTIGVPTANLRCDDQMLPTPGVYAGRCQVDNRMYPVALNIGPAPTFNAPPQIEAHLIGFDGDLYDRVLEVQIVDWLRDVLKFDGVESLKRQLAKDLISAEARR